jgi:hypothetical protein
MLEAMRRAITVGQATLGFVAGAAGLCALAPDAAQAARGYHLTLAVAPDPDVSGDPLTMVGTLTNSRGLPVEGVRLELYHRVNPAPFFTPIQRTRTTAGGFFEINRAEGVVISNREWYIVARGPHGIFLAHSRIVRERVYAELTLAASTTTALTGQPVTFGGTVAPRHTGERVVIERQVGATGTSWRRVGSAIIEPGGTFSFTRTFARPSELGPATFRAVLPADDRNIRSFSEPVQVTIQQAENADLTLMPSSPVVVVNQPVVLTGKLLTPVSGGVGGQLVTLYARTHGNHFSAVATATSNPEGGFSFTQTPINNTAYRVRAGGRVSAPVFEGVRDTISATPSATAGEVGQRITVSGLVTPAHVGDIVYLQLLNSAGHYQTIQVAFLGAGSTYSMLHQLQSAGSKTYRVYIPGDSENLGAASEPFTVNVTPAAALPQLEGTPAPEA